MMAIVIIGSVKIRDGVHVLSSAVDNMIITADHADSSGATLLKTCTSLRSSKLPKNKYLTDEYMCRAVDAELA